MRREPRARTLSPLVADGLLAAFFTVLAQVELQMRWDDGYHAGPLLLNSVLQVLVTVPLVLRTVRPRLALVLMCAAVAVPALVTGRTFLFWGDMLPLTVVVFTVARASRGWWAWVPAPIATVAGMTVAVHNPEMPFTDGFFALAVFGAAQLLGRLVGRLTEQRARLTVALAQLALEQRFREEAAVQDERRRIAAEMHDVVAHAVSLMTIQVGAARMRLETSGQDVPGELRAAEEAGRSALGELRRTLGVLRRAADEGGLEPMPGTSDLAALVDRYRTAGLDVHARFALSADLAASLQLAAYRIVQESLTNVVRHAGEVRTEVEVTDDAGELVVRVENSPGHGSGGRGGGNGLTGMRERVAMFGGSLVVGRTPDRGFRVLARMPLGVVEPRPGAALGR